MRFKSLLDHMKDIEEALKAGLKTEDEVLLSQEQAQALLDRLQDYRKRLNTSNTKYAKKLAPLHSELSEFKRLFATARARIDPELEGTQFSQMDRAEVAYLVKLIEDRRGRIVAQRLLWGKTPEIQLQAETIGVLRAAVEATKKEHARWFTYLKEARQKITPIQALTMSVFRDECDCKKEPSGCEKKTSVLKKVADLLGF